MPALLSLIPLIRNEYGNNGLGLMLLGVTGDQVLPLDVYEDIKLKDHIEILQY